MSLDSNAIVTLADVKTFLKITQSDFDTILEMLINSLSTAFDVVTGRTLKQAVYTDEYFDGNGLPDFILPQAPVSAIASLYEDDILLVENTDFKLYSNNYQAFIRKLYGNWSKGDKNLKISFTGGFAVTLNKLLDFDDGSEIPNIGATLIGHDSAAQGDLVHIYIESGTPGGGNMVGHIELESVSGTFQNNENIDISGGNSNVMTVDGVAYGATPAMPKDLQLAMFKQIGAEYQKYKAQNWHEASRSFPDGSSAYIEKDDFLPDVWAILQRYSYLL